MINKSLRISLITVVLPVVLQLIYIRYISYNVDKNDFGDFIILSTFVVALSQIFLMIPSVSFTRFYNGSNKLFFINEFRTYLIGINLLSIVFVYLLYFFYGDRFNTIIYILIYLYFAISNNYTLNQQIFLLNIDRNKYLILKVMEAMAKFIFPIIGYFFYQTLEAFLTAIVLGYILSFVIIFFYLKEYPFKVEFNLINQKKYFLYAYPIIFSAILTWSMSFSDRFFIDYYMETKDVAIYAILAQFAGFAQVLGMVFSIYVNPIVLQQYEINSSNGLMILKNYLVKFFYINIFTFLVIIFLPKSLLGIFIEKNIIYNDSYYLTFIILVLGIFLTVFQTAMSMYFILLKKLNIHAKIFLVASIANFLLNFYIIKYGMLAAAASTLIAYLIINIGVLLWLKQHLTRVVDD